MKIDYRAGAPRTYGLTLDLWSPARWERFRRLRIGRLVWDSPCARRTTLGLAEGRAEIFEGYSASIPLRPPCPDRPPDRVIAHVYFEGVVVAVNMPYCYTCAARPPGLADPYDSVSGMEAIARGLRLRTPRR